MHGLGNDFVVLDLITQRFVLQAKHVQSLADRHFGIGCDQVLVVEPPQNPEADFRYRIFNADGSEVEQCGNGARCFARFVRDKHLTSKQSIIVETSGGIIELKIHKDQQVEVNMGVPQLAPKQLPFQATEQLNSYPLPVDGQDYQIGAVSIGNPHAVMRVDSIEQAPVATLGPQIESHSRFPKRVNAGFMEVLDRQHIKLRVFERGVGETQACGTGACAAVVYGRLMDWLDDEVSVYLPGGKLHIEWAGEGQVVRMTGPAATVYEGKIHL